jgi:mono/diheme cytochrome c family protein
VTSRRAAGLVTLIAITIAALSACATFSALAPIEPPSRSSFDPALVAKGAALAALGNCVDCHTAAGGKAFAGGRPLETPFGTIYGTNITPDPETGVGRWSEDAFRRAMREGVDREGRHLYPVFPYDHFTRLTDEDLGALYAFVMTRDPVRNVPLPNELPFPLSSRSLIAVWKALYFERGAFNPDPTQSPQWNRGAYLVQGLAHCGACHTPRNALGAELRQQDLAGGVVEGWHAPALDASSPAPVPWTAERLYTYLRTGLDDLHAIAAGPMDPVVRNLAKAPDGDVRAIAVYIAARIGKPAFARRPQGDEAAFASEAGDAYGRGADIYVGACAQCHDQGRDVSSGGALDLSLGSSTTMPTSANLIRITLEGIPAPDDERARFMPGFATALTDAQVKDLMVYIRAHFGREPPWRDIDRELRKARSPKRS